MECFSFTHTPPGHNQVPFTWYIVSGYQENYWHYKRQKTQSEETQQASKPDVAEMLSLLNQKYKITYVKGSTE